MTRQPARDPAPFIVGAARSGTTLLRMMLDAHSQLAIPPETNFNEALAAFERGAAASAAAEALVQDPRWEDFNIPASELLRQVEAGNPGDIGELARIFYRLYAERRGKSRWGDKSPYNVRGMAAIQRYLPEARFVHVIRDGRDVALSVMPLWFGPDTVGDAARAWAGAIAHARAEAAHLPFYTEVRYEDLVSEPAATLRRLCDFLGLEWEASLLEYHLHADERLAAETVAIAAPGRTVSRDERLGIHRLLGQPPGTGRIGRWRSEMDAGDLRTFEHIAGEALTACGYALESPGASIGQ